MNLEKHTKYKSQFLEFKDELLSFLFRLVSNRAQAEDLVHDAYIKAFEKIDTFRAESSFKTWVFAIAHNLTKNQMVRQQKWREDAQQLNAKLHIESTDMFEDMLAVYNSKTDVRFEIEEHITYCFNCMMKTLELEQQVCLWLKNIYAFKIHEIMHITGLTAGRVKHAIANARQHLVRIFDDKCAFVNQKGTCHQCTSLKGILNPDQDAQAEANKLKLVKEKDAKQKEHLLDLRLELIQSINPINAPGHHLHTYFLENSPKWVKLALSKNTE